MAKSNMNMLQYLQSKTQVDFDNLDMDAYNELINPHRAALIKKAAALAHQIRKDYPEMVACAQTIVPNITGAILVMANPLFAYSTQKTFDNGRRLYAIATRLQPSFDTSRLIVKVASTWEGLQACRKLKELGVKTLATTAFTLEQCILAGEVGCIYVSPFLNELRAAVEPDYHDEEPIFDIIVDAQRYFKEHGYPIRVKACAALTTDQILRLAGVDAFTAPADQLQELVNMEGPPPASLFLEDGGLENGDGAAENGHVGEKTNGHANGETNGHANGETNGYTNGGTNGHANGDSNGAVNGQTDGHAAKKDGKKKLAKRTFIDDESAYRLAFAKADSGRGQLKTTQALNIFSEYQIKAEAMMGDADMTMIG
ncbi:MAG: hypothetical protein Q9186_005723 [Xanthomendoza sp. 1 TL-2023]